MNESNSETNLTSDSECIFKRGDKVRYKDGNETYVWAVNPHMMIRYVIEHPLGWFRQELLSDFYSGKFPDGFESVKSTELADNIKYIYARPQELTLIE